VIFVIRMMALQSWMVGHPSHENEGKTTLAKQLKHSCTPINTGSGNTIGLCSTEDEVEVQRRLCICMLSLFSENLVHCG